MARTSITLASDGYLQAATGGAVNIFGDMDLDVQAQPDIEVQAPVEVDTAEQVEVEIDPPIDVEVPS